MKVAVCVSGLCRLPQNTVLERNKQQQSIFHTADFYYHTWDGYQHMVPSPIQDRLYVSDEPTVDYCPVTDTPPSRNKKHEDYVRLKSQRAYTKHKHSTKQIIAHADLLKTFDKNQYDVIVRLRWDSKLSNKVNFNQWLKVAKDQGPVGFMHRRVDNLDVVRVADQTAESNDWCEYLPDIVIMHSPKHFDPATVYLLHNQKVLRAAEWGWYQVLSQPYGDIHTSIRGGAKSSDGHGRMIKVEKRL